MELQSTSELRNIENYQAADGDESVSIHNLKREQNKQSYAKVVRETNDNPVFEKLNEFITVRNRRNKVRNVGTYTTRMIMLSNQPNQTTRKKDFGFLSQWRWRETRQILHCKKSKQEQEEITVSALDSKSIEGKSNCFLAGVPLDVMETVNSVEF
ncbi:hypothetical protein WA026_014193 [Henosepilachna vigintioctopunctata]|uniref:Uncharacterized protein n=1 Tax=Henosepilachna vigintioctopunctata TaxID=420089 RepID=A0AAW1TVI8_9CUCU